MSNNLLFTELSLRNFLSFGNSDTVIDLNTGKTISIEGKNKDRNNSSNGSGKTTLINAICYALYNKPFSNISLQRLINNTNSTKNTSMEVTISFMKNADEYVVKRTRGESYSIVILKNGEDITPGKGVTECDQYIQSIIGMSYDVFTKTMIFSGNSPAFLNLPVAQQRSTIEELFNITILSEKAVILRDKIKNTERDIDIKAALIKQQEKVISAYNAQIIDAENRIKQFDANKETNLQNIHALIERVKGIDFVLEEQLWSDIETLEQERQNFKVLLPGLTKDFERLAASISEKTGEQEVLSHAKCPYCNQHFADSESKSLELSTVIHTGLLELETFEQKINELNANISSIETKISEMKLLSMYKSKPAMLTDRDNLKVSEQKIDELQKADNPYTDILVTLRKNIPESPDLEGLNILKKTLEHQQFLLKLLTNKDSFVRRKIINKNTPFLNARINERTIALGLPHVVKFDTDMSCTVSEFGRELDFGNLSAGEQKRINTALALAFRDVNHHLHAKTNLLMVDELDGALDPGGIDDVIKILKCISRDEDCTIFVISHHPNILGRLDETMTIQKEFGFSTIS